MILDVYNPFCKILQSLQSAAITCLIYNLTVYSAC